MLYQHHFCVFVVNLLIVLRLIITLRHKICLSALLFKARIASQYFLFIIFSASVRVELLRFKRKEHKASFSLILFLRFAKPLTLSNDHYKLLRRIFDLGLNNFLPGYILVYFSSIFVSLLFGVCSGIPPFLGNIPEASSKDPRTKPLKSIGCIGRKSLYSWCFSVFSDRGLYRFSEVYTGQNQSNAVINCQNQSRKLKNNF